ncbi:MULTISPECIES: hypothetical protein [Streptomyces]|uniref:hypothetical protein n=1 Tax=Streptomyces TaxID=1883 RepID=UPI0004C4D4AE|nr:MULTISPECIES: hypothetical protein [Streptomyces]
MHGSIAQLQPHQGPSGSGTPEGSHPRQWTVIGLRDRNGRLTVAGVAPGDVPMADSHPGTAEATRYADTFVAPSADEAEALAVAHCAGEDDEQPFREGDTVRHILDAARGTTQTGTVADICPYTGAVVVDWPTGREKHQPGELLHA